MLRCLTWNSPERSPRLTPDEVNSLFFFTYQLAEAGGLSEGKYKGASLPLYWERLKGNN